jgi:hypothetical protein
LLDPGPLVMAVIPVIMRVSTLNADSRRSGVRERGRLSFDAVLLIVIGSQRRVLSHLIRGREHFAGTRYEFVERRQAHPDIIRTGRRRRGR